MNKKLIAMAVAASMAAPLAAQAEVTLYGQLQIELQNIDIKNSDATDGIIVNPGSYVGQAPDPGGNTAIADNKRGRLGVKGAEDLGDGLKAIYKFEWQVNTATADVDDGDRESYVGLTGNWGTFLAGALKSPYKYTGGVTYDPLVTTAGEARRYGGMTTGVFGHNGFFQNTIAYATPKVGGFSAAIGYVPDNTDGANGSNAWDIKFNHKNFEVFFAQSNYLDSTTDNSNFTANKVGGKITFAKMWTILAQYEMTTDEQGPGAGDDKGNLGFLGLQVKLGKNMLVAQGGSGKVDFDASTTDQTNTYYALGWIYKFTKKTRVFLTYRDSSTDDANGVSGNKNDSSAASAGLRIAF
jgi:predicted porin